MEQMGPMTVKPTSIQWKTSIKYGIWVQELIMLNSKHAEFKETHMWNGIIREWCKDWTKEELPEFNEF